MAYVVLLLIAGIAGVLATIVIVDARFARQAYDELPDTHRAVSPKVQQMLMRLEWNELEDIRRPPRSMIEFVAAALARKRAAPTRELAWQVRKWLMRTAVRFELGEREITALYCHYLPFLTGIGLQEAAISHFGRTLENLSELELIRLVAISRNPYSEESADIGALNQNMRTLSMRYEKNKSRDGTDEE